MGNLEILAPVGSFKNLKLAINSGANAVYFGVKGFNAREKAENIDIAQLKEFVELAHLHNVKTYMTLNTLIKNEEIEDVLKVVDFAIEAKVDAYIIQDIGLATFLLKNYKNIVLHASTQMGIHNLAGAKVLEELGFQRVVLSRETKLEDVIDIKNNTNLEIEYFVQGALCVAFSGNCYFSSLCFGESGNRGKCLQPCRMLYEAYLKDEKVKEGYLISPKDLCFLRHMEILKTAGVTSFKIEGRLRREAYLIQSVSSYAKVLEGADVNKEINSLKKIFTRGDYNYGNYLYGNDNIINSELANHRGIKIGKVKSFQSFKDLYKIVIESDKKLNAFDGIKIVNGYRELSIGVGNVEINKFGNYIIYTKHKPFIGDVYLSSDYEYEKSLIKEDKKLPLDIEIEAKENKVLKAKIKYGKICAEVVGDVVCEKAKNQPISTDDFNEIFNRIKDTEFKINTIKFNIDHIFVPKSIINKFKNKFILKIKNKILEDVRKGIEDIIKVGDIDKNYESYGRLDSNNDNFVCCKIQIKNDKICNILSPEIYNLRILENFINDNNDRFIYLNLPIIATKDEVKIIDEMLYTFKGKIGIVINNYWHLKYIKDFKFLVGYNMNILNNLSANFYIKLGAVNYVRSIEGYLTNGLKGGLSYEGFPTLMTWCHCPYKVSLNSNCNECKYSENLTYKLNDGKIFKIRRYKIINCYFELVSTKKIESKSNKKYIDLR